MPAAFAPKKAGQQHLAVGLVAGDVGNQQRGDLPERLPVPALDPLHHSVHQYALGRIGMTGQGDNPDAHISIDDTGVLKHHCLQSPHSRVGSMASN